eukprot:CAMPEP_0180706838 /NCGR_PEP_ID=MMETSP1038_2-20121128/8407_1 /TAXON_ID=632150 /ORGANISM="Azadinium spinosum, Strain 3D9" /LENGTH=91 /DNA_ID=CAMNT_0022738773 /DNA_START=374 /DNA_END=650 /DNA_ORIENTATION=-
MTGAGVHPQLHEVGERSRCDQALDHPMPENVPGPANGALPKAANQQPLHGHHQGEVGAAVHKGHQPRNHHAVRIQYLLLALQGVSLVVPSD